MGDKCEISRNSAIEHNFPGPARQDKTNWTFPTVQSERQSAVMERQRRCWGQNLESLITDPPPALLLHLKISDPDTLHSALDPPYTVIRKISV